MENFAWIESVPYMGWFFKFWKWQGSPLVLTSFILTAFCIRAYFSSIFPTVHQFIQLIAYSVTLVASSKMFLTSMFMANEAWVTYTGAAVTGLVAVRSLTDLFNELGVKKPELIPNGQELSGASGVNANSAKEKVTS